MQNGVKPHELKITYKLIVYYVSFTLTIEIFCQLL